MNNSFQLRFTVPVLLKPGAKYADGTSLGITSQLVTSAGKEQKNLLLTVSDKAEQTVGTVSVLRCLSCTVKVRIGSRRIESDDEIGSEIVSVLRAVSETDEK